MSKGGRRWKLFLEERDIKARTNRDVMRPERGKKNLRRLCGDCVVMPTEKESICCKGGALLFFLSAAAQGKNVDQTIGVGINVPPTSVQI